MNCKTRSPKYVGMLIKIKDHPKENCKCLQHLMQILSLKKVLTFNHKLIGIACKTRKQPNPLCESFYNQIIIQFNFNFTFLQSAQASNSSG